MSDQWHKIENEEVILDIIKINDVNSTWSQCKTKLEKKSQSLQRYVSLNGRGIIALCVCGTCFSTMKTKKTMHNIGTIVLLPFVCDLVPWLLILLPGRLSLSVCFPVWWLLRDSRGLDGWFNTDLLWNRMNITSRWCFLVPSLFSGANCLAHVQGGDHGLWEQKAWHT